MDRLAPRLAGERLRAFADGVRARQDGRPPTDNPFAGQMLRASQAREWNEGWAWEDRQHWWERQPLASKRP